MTSNVEIRELGVLIMVVGFAASVSVVGDKVFATYVVRGPDKRVGLRAGLDLVFTTEIEGWEREACIEHARIRGLLP